MKLDRRYRSGAGRNYASPEAIKRSNDNRRRIRCADGSTKVVYPSHPEYPHETPATQRRPEIHPELLRIRAEQREVFAKGTQTTARYGFVYCMINPTWPGFVKIGRSLDPIDRLNSYQTGDPHRSYEMVGFEYTEDRKRVEKEVHSFLRAKQIGTSEWYLVSPEQALEAVRLHCA